MSVLKLKTLNGSVTLQPEDGTGDVVVPLRRGGSPLKTDEVIAWEAVNGELTWAGGAYTDPDAVGANPDAKIYPDGTIAGSTDNGNYTKYPNGDFTWITSQSIATGAGGTVLISPLVSATYIYGTSTHSGSTTSISVAIESSSSEVTLRHSFAGEAWMTLVAHSRWK